MKDLHVISLALIALVLHLGVFLLPLMGIAVRSPLAVLTASTALVVVLILCFATRSFDAATTTLLIVDDPRPEPPPTPTAAITKQVMVVIRFFYA